MLKIPRYPSTPQFTSEQVEHITRAVFVTPPNQVVHKGDVIFIFGGSHPGLWETAYKAYEQGLAEKIIVTGGSRPKAGPHPSWEYGDASEAGVIAMKLVDLGVDKRHLVLEEESTNSLENVLYAKQVFDFSGIDRVLMVTKSYAAGRQSRTLKKHLPVTVSIHPYVFDTNLHGQLVTATNWIERGDISSFVFGEYLRIVCYSQKGDIWPIDFIAPGLEEYVYQYCEEKR